MELNKKRPLYIKAKEKTTHLIKKLESARYFVVGLDFVLTSMSSYALIVIVSKPICNSVYHYLVSYLPYYLINRSQLYVTKLLQLKGLVYKLVNVHSEFQEGKFST